MNGKEYGGCLHRVQYYETDQMGVVHHSNYIRWFEEARIDWLDEMGLAYDEMERQGIMSPVLSVSCQYKKPVRFGETVRIVPSLAQYNGVKMMVRYRVLDPHTGEERAAGETSHCFIRTDTRLPARIKKTHPAMDALFASQLDAQ